MPEDSFSQIHVLDLGNSYKADREQGKAVEALGNSFESNGFLVVTNHGVSNDQINEVEMQARKFFAQPYETKALSKAPPGVFRGYTAMEKTALSLSRDIQTPPDACEVFSLNHFDDRLVAEKCGLKEGREDFFAPNIWPSNLPEFKETLRSYYTAMEGLADHLMQLSALALGLEENWFEDKINDHITNLTLNYYPKIESNLLDDQLRRGEHSDWGTLTILHHDGESGLQIKDSLGEWVDVPSVPDSFVVNLGDLMARWTNDRWKSTVHRVVPPKDLSRDRLSLVFFHQPAYDAVIECIPTCVSPENPSRYEPVTSGEWILEMQKKTTF
tara:strand:+ start:681 stop:1664 length:984 start_codon:yes stop_codon:yes gene_type:complete